MKAATNALSSLEIWFILIQIRFKIWRLSSCIHRCTNRSHHGIILSSNVTDPLVASKSMKVLMSAILVSSLRLVTLFSSARLCTRVNKSDGTPLFTSTIIFKSRTLDEPFVSRVKVSPVGNWTLT